ncbi:MAG: DUF86 domain-containing protein [Nitrospirae bacterium]|nr:DUF86 domain-containing protein [Nitrospirota bacterium]
MVFVNHILEETEYLLKEAEGLTYDDLLHNETLKRAFIRSLEIIGKASKNLSEPFKKKHAGIKWKEMAGLRDKLIHHYFGVNWKIVWDVIMNRIPELKNKLKAI